MTDVVTSSDAAEPGRPRRLGERRRPRHRRAPGTEPFAVPTAVTPAVAPSVAPTEVAAPPAVAPARAARRTSVTAPAPTGERHAAPGRRFPARTAVAAAVVVGVAALFAITTSEVPVVPAPEPTPLAAPAGVVAEAPPVAPVVPRVPAAIPPAPVPSTTTQVPAITPAGPAPVVGALFDSETGSFDDLFDNSGNEGLIDNGPLPRIVQNAGAEAWQFTLPGGGRRSEVLPEGPGTEPRDGDVQFVRYSAVLDDDFPTDTAEWQVVLQWHHDSPNGSPPLALQITRGQLMMVSGGDDMRAIGPVSPGQAVNLTMRVVFSQDPGSSSVTVWRDGRPTGVTDWSPVEGTMSTETAYLKMGIYRTDRIRQAGSMLVTDLKIGRNAAGIGGIGPRPLGAS